jgi:hypothetical protein
MTNICVGYLAKKWHNGTEHYGRAWLKGDVIGCFLDLNDKTICEHNIDVSQNGK